MIRRFLPVVVGLAACVTEGMAQVDPSGHWRTWTTEHFRIHARAELASWAVKLAAEVDLDPIGHEAAVGIDLHARAVDLELGGVLEPHVVGVMADAFGQTPADSVACGGRKATVCHE